MAQLLKHAGALAVANGSLVKGGPDVTGIRETPFGWVSRQTQKPDNRGMLALEPARPDGEVHTASITAAR